MESNNNSFTGYLINFKIIFLYLQTELFMSY